MDWSCADHAKSAWFAQLLGFLGWRSCAGNRKSELLCTTFECWFDMKLCGWPWIRLVCKTLSVSSEVKFCSSYGIDLICTTLRYGWETKLCKRSSNWWICITLIISGTACEDETITGKYFLQLLFHESKWSCVLIMIFCSCRQLRLSSFLLPRTNRLPGIHPKQSFEEGGYFLSASPSLKASPTLSVTL